MNKIKNEKILEIEHSKECERKNDYLVDLLGIVISALVNPVALILTIKNIENKGD